MKKQKGVVYSTELGRTCPGCGEPVDSCRCKNDVRPDPGDGIVRLRRESKGRGGKTVIVISGLPLTESELRDMAKKLKAKCGCGGSVKNGTIEIQGDKRELLIAELTGLGYRTKASGG